MSEPRTVTISLPPELAARVDEMAAREGRSRSELFREAARQYLRRHERWEQIFAYGAAAAERAGVDDEDQVAQRVTERRRARRGG
jgi:CopG family transcriptional regulator/antitoxin EndoAI